MLAEGRNEDVIINFSEIQLFQMIYLKKKKNSFIWFGKSGKWTKTWRTWEWGTWKI